MALDEVAKTAGVANATLYRHVASRAELIVAVYAAEVAGLLALGQRLSNHADPRQAFTEWLRAFAHDVATKRDLALAVPADADGRRGMLFADWHAAMHDTAARLLTCAQQASAVRPELNAADLLVLASGIALTGLPASRLDASLGLARDGYRSSEHSRPDTAD